MELRECGPAGAIGYERPAGVDTCAWRSKATAGEVERLFTRRVWSADRPRRGADRAQRSRPVARLPGDCAGRVIGRPARSMPPRSTSRWRDSTSWTAARATTSRLRLRRSTRHAVDRAYCDIVDDPGASRSSTRATAPSPIQSSRGRGRSRTSRHSRGGRGAAQTLVEDEYRDYEEAHASTAAATSRGSTIDEFEDASIEYGSLLTREMMGLSLSKRERVRRRELERMLLVT